ACAPLLLSAGLVALAQLRGTTARARLASGFSVEELRFEDEPRKTTSEASTPCKELQTTPSTPTTPSTSTSSPQKGKGGKVPPPPKGAGNGPSKNAVKGPAGTPKGKAGVKGGKGTPPKGGALATKRSDTFEDREGEAKAQPFGTRRIRWRTISDHAGTVFDGLDSTAPYNETRKMLHEVLAASVVQQTARPSAFVPKSSGVCLLDRNRAQQLAIAFRRSPLPLQKLCLALQTLDFSIPLSEEEIEGLLKAWPTDVDFRQVAKHEGPTEELRDVEQCIRQVASVPRSEARLKLLRLSRSLDSLSGIFGHLGVLQT
ncbi:FH3, partial [Symbiodinium sp. CCMP2456]